MTSLFGHLQQQFEIYPNKLVFLFYQKRMWKMDGWLALNATPVLIRYGRRVHKILAVIFLACSCWLLLTRECKNSSVKNNVQLCGEHWLLQRANIATSVTESDAAARATWPSQDGHLSKQLIFYLCVLFILWLGVWDQSTSSNRCVNKDVPRPALIIVNFFFFFCTFRTMMVWAPLSLINIDPATWSHAKRAEKSRRMWDEPGMN